MEIKVSLLQYRVEPGKFEENLQRLWQKLYAAEGDLLIAPELALTGYHPGPFPDLPAELLEWIQARGGSLLLGHPSREGDRCFNAVFLLSSEGIKEVARKEALFPTLDPPMGFSPGRYRNLFDLKGYGAGVLICYEIRFPEMARYLVSRGAAFLLILAQWPKERYAHLRTLAQARAIENQAFVLVCNALGRAGEVELAGGSFAFSPSGELLGELGEREDVLTISLETESLKEARRILRTSAPRPPFSPEAKVLSLEELKEEVQRRRILGHRMVFTNGCFDLLHAGHVSYLYEARRLGDFLVVGLNSDESVRRLKGPERPINPQDQRALVLAGLSCVDYVVIFEEDTPERLIKALVPEVLVKGADWPEDKIVGADFVKSRGGRVVRLPFRYQVSTSAIVQRIRES